MIINKDNIQQGLDILKNSKETLYSVDIETYNPFEGQWFMGLSAKQRPLNRIDSKITSVQIELRTGENLFFDFNQKQEEEDLRLDYSYLPAILKKCKIMVGHNLSFEYGMFARHGYDFPGDLHDTMIMGVLYNENMPQGLKPTIKHRFDHQMPSYAETVGEGTMKDLTAVACYDYGMSDTHWTLKLYDWLVPRINMDYYDVFEKDLIKIIAKQYAQGQVIDLQELDRIQAEDLQERSKIVSTFPILGELNLNSPKQMSNWLFNDMGLKPFKVSKKTGAPSTDKESLFELELEYGKTYPVIKAFSDIKKIETRLKLYYKPYPNLVYPDGLLHAEIRQTGTVTGRFSMNSPNLQQVAKKGEGVKVRGVIVPFVAKGHDCIVSIDWSQIELRIAAHVSGDAKLIDAYTTNKDLHTVSGTNISGDDYDTMIEKLKRGDKEAKAARQAGKCLNFAALYLAQPKRLSAFDLLDCTVAEAEDFLMSHKKGYDTYFYEYVNKVNAELKATAKVHTIFGRSRYLPDVRSTISFLKNKAEGQGLNFTIQGSAAELMKVGLITLAQENLLFEKDFTFIAPVHDQYVFSAKRSLVSTWLPKVMEIMERVPKGFVVPIIADATIGPNFAKEAEIGRDFSQTNIDAVWRKAYEK